VSYTHIFPARRFFSLGPTVAALGLPRLRRHLRCATISQRVYKPQQGQSSTRKTVSILACVRRIRRTGCAIILRRCPGPRGRPPLNANQTEVELTA
jgi:hypothetical protein